MNNPLLSETINTRKKSQEHARPEFENTEKNTNASLHPLLQMQQAVGNRAVGQLIQRKKAVAKVNKTGLPDNLKAGLENLSGMSMADVNVHYNSPEPSQLQALAYTKGSDIHIAPGQEKHLPHEAWHVVQQKQGRVTPTMQLKGEQVNDNFGLEREADAMGARASHVSVQHGVQRSAPQEQRGPSGDVVQRLRLNPNDNAYYSAATPIPVPEYKITNQNEAFLTATSNLGPGGGHTGIVLEYFQDVDEPVTYAIDLFVAGARRSSSGSSSGSSGGVSRQSGPFTTEGTSGSSGSTQTTQTGEGSGKIRIEIKQIPPGEAAVKMASKKAGQKKTWKKTRPDAFKAIKHAREVQKAAAKKRSKLKYYLFGKGPAKAAMNCARFGQAVLKAAKIPIHIGFWKLPSKITKPSKTDESIEKVVSLSDLTELQDSKFPTAWRTKSGFLGKTGVSNKTMSEIGKGLEKYHKFPEPLLRYLSIRRSGLLMIEYILKRLIRAGLTKDSKDDEAKAIFAELKKQPWMTFLSSEFLPALTQEVQAITHEVKTTDDSPWEDVERKMDLLQIRLDHILSENTTNVAYYVKTYARVGNLNFLQLGNFP